MNQGFPYRCVLVTGGAGFIGSSFLRLMHRTHPDLHLINLDKLTYAGNLDNLLEIAESPRYAFVQGDICKDDEVTAAFAVAQSRWNLPVEAVVHFAAETHVDRSIADPRLFLETNVLGTEVMLRVARKHSVERFVLISTDEVYGTLGATGKFSETTPLAPNSPYSASKTGGDLIARAYFETYGFPVLTTRCSNNYGQCQFPEKLIPLMLSNALEDKSLPVYGDGGNVRDWIFVDDHSRGVETVLVHGKPGEVYNLGGCSEKNNLEVVRTILKQLGKPESLITFVPDRPGHDRRYAVDITKAQRELGWSPSVSFEQGIAATVQWYLDHPEWVARVRSGAYQEYYRQMYEHRT